MNGSDDPSFHVEPQGSPEQNMRLANVYRVAFANLHLRVERERDSWAVRICDLGERETLYQTRTATALEAKIAAVNFALVRLFGPGHTKDTRRLAESLSWNLST